MFKAYKDVKEIKLRICLELYEFQVTQAFDVEIKCGNIWGWWADNDVEEDDDYHWSEEEEEWNDTECEDDTNGTESETGESSDGSDDLSKYQSGDETRESSDCDSKVKNKKNNRGKGIGKNIFKVQDGGKIEFYKGMEFPTIKEFREALKDYIIQEGFEIKRIKNERTRVTCECAYLGCKWRIHASPIAKTITFSVKSYNPIHTCIRVTRQNSPQSMNTK